jgi:Mini-chromosome maintenance protein 2
MTTCMSAHRNQLLEHTCLQVTLSSMSAGVSLDMSLGAQVCAMLTAGDRHHETLHQQPYKWTTCCSDYRAMPALDRYDDADIDDDEEAGDALSGAGAVAARHAAEAELDRRDRRARGMLPGAFSGVTFWSVVSALSGNDGTLLRQQCDAANVMQRGVPGRSVSSGTACQPGCGSSIGCLEASARLSLSCA